MRFSQTLMSAGARSRTTISDAAVHSLSAIDIWARFGRMGLRRGPLGTLRELRRFPWLRVLLRVERLLGTLVRGRSGPYRQANALLVREVTAAIVEMVEGLFYRPQATVLHEDLVPPEILLAMDLHPWMAEFLGIVVPLVDCGVTEHYVDVAENEGIPPDICSLPKSTMGLALEGHLPRPRAIVTSNLPCDGGMASYALLERELGAPTFRLDVPFNFYDARAESYFVGELRRLIAWLEEHTPGRMDWDRLRAICDQRNRMVAIELELWDLLRARPAPMAGEPITLGHLMFTQACPGSQRGTRYFQRLLELARKVHAGGGGALGRQPGGGAGGRGAGGRGAQGGELRVGASRERYRIALWNPPTLCFPDLFVWAEETYGVALLMDMLAYNRHPLIDTRTAESMLAGLAKIFMQGAMARHTRGPCENFFGDLFHLREQFGLDMLWMAGHIGCKNTQALCGMLREKCRERGIPLLIIDYDLSDTRIVPPADMRRQVEQFMESVMKAERSTGSCW